MLKLICPICKKSKTGSTINECVLSLKHHEECDANKGLAIPYGPECWEDDKFS